ncbi:hypothetical protein [Caballeronia udeis]|uniref:hypothetical protein n=1 Tax=Caballeronia udeis TaxID=1232866 RepID=UPI000785DFB8|nr:hypothetical protein [Caballeronia udeis]
MQPQPPVQWPQMLFAKAGRRIAFDFLNTKVAIAGITSFFYRVEEMKRSTRFLAGPDLPLTASR